MNSGTTYYYRLLIRYDSSFTLWTNEVSATAGVSLTLNAETFDLAIDVPRSRVYVSIPTLNEVAILSSVDLSILDRVVVGTRPMGICLSQDGNRLFCALNQAGSVAVLDLQTRGVETIIIGNELGDARTWDVIEPVPNVLLVSSNPGSSGFAYIVKVDLDFQQGHTAQRVANNAIIRAAPIFLSSPGGQYVYVGEGFSPNSLYKLDTSQSDIPIVLEDDHGSVSGTDHMAINPDGSEIVLRSGQILSAATFEQVGLYPTNGVPQVNPDGLLCYMGQFSDIQVFRRSTQLQIGTLPISNSVSDMLLLDDGNAMVVLSGTRVFEVNLAARRR